jgi:hypothetical protein
MTRVERLVYRSRSGISANWWIVLLSATATPCEGTNCNGSSFQLRKGALTRRYHRLHICSMGHSGAPKGEVQVEFLTGDPQRRVYVYYQKSNGKVVSVTYEKMGDGETFSKDEIQYLTGLNQGVVW